MQVIQKLPKNLILGRLMYEMMKAAVDFNQPIMPAVFTLLIALGRFIDEFIQLCHLIGLDAHSGQFTGQSLEFYFNFKSTADFMNIDLRNVGTEARNNVDQFQINEFLNRFPQRRAADMKLLAKRLL